MDAQTNRFMRSQVMKKLLIAQQAMRESPRPREGWIRCVRKSLRMTVAQLGKRIGVSRQRVARLEKDELLGNVTLKTISQAAEAMDCSFVYWIVAKTTLEEIVRKQARKLAEATLSTKRIIMNSVHCCVSPDRSAVGEQTPLTCPRSTASSLIW